MCKFVTIFISDAKGLRQSWRNTHMIQFKVMNSGGAYIIKLGIHAGMLLAGILLICCCAGCGSRDKMREEDSLQVLLTEEEDFSGHEDSGQTQDGLSGDNSEEEAQDEGEEGQKSGESPEKVFVHICGAVRTPGVYELPADARVYEAVLCAGGMREDAAEEIVNQAKILTDGEQIYIPTDSEVLESREQGLEGDVWNGSPVMQAGQSEQEYGAGSSAEKKVNINTASREELMTLNGIGETRADSIIAYREANGGFEKVEDLMKVEGIKEGVFNKIKDSIEVGAGS